MSSRVITRRVAALGLLALGGCGFAPVYGTGSSPRGAFQFETDSSVAGFRTKERLERRLGIAATPRFVLSVTQSQRQSAAAINTDGDTVRFNVIGTANWTLRPVGGGPAIADGTVENFTSFAATGSTVATQAASTDASARLAVTLADMIVARVLLLDLPQ